MKQKRCLIGLQAVFLTMLLVISFMAGGAGIRALAKEEKKELSDSSNAGGIQITTSVDKESYGDSDTAELTVSVTNTNSYDVTDVGVTYKLPTNFTLASGQATQTIDKLAAGETKEFQVSAVVKTDEHGEVVEVGPSKQIIILIIVAVAVVIAAVAIVFMMIRRRKGGKGPKPPKAGVSMLLILALLSVSISSAAVPVQAETEAKTVVNDDYMPRISVHDPSIVKDPKTGTYYIFGTHLSFAKSTDLLRWERVNTNVQTDYNELFAEPWDWAKYVTPAKDTLRSRAWAPDVIWNETMKKWCMYMSIDGDDWCSAICLLTADEIEGPYAYQGIVVYSGMNNANNPPDVSKTDVYKVLGEDADLSRYKSTANACINAIDPCVKFDDNGDLYMVYGSWSAGIFMLKLDPQTGLRDYNTTYETKIDESDAYLGTKIAGGHYNSGEAPYIIKAGKYYYFFISYAGLSAVEGYQMRIYRSENITGPYVDQNGESPICKNSEDMKGSNRGEKIFGSYQIPGLPRVQVAQGHNSALLDDDGKIYLVYHTRFQSDTGTNELHQVRVHQLFVNEDDWLVAAPYEYGGETLPEEGYPAEDIEGEYSFIYHEPTQYYNVSGGKQRGIVGAQEVTTKEIELQKYMVVGGHKTSFKCAVSYSHEGAEKVVLKKDGTVEGDYSGTWKTTSGANVVMELNGVTYKGVFLRQQDESIDRNSRMTFTLTGDNVTVWGVGTDEKEGITGIEGIIN